MTDPERAIALKLALRSWRDRSYMQDVAWTQSNEERREKRVETIASLLTYYRRHRTFTENQRPLVDKLIKSAT